MVGCFINAVPIRIRFNEKTTFSELIREAQKKAVQSEPYHYCSLAEIQMESPLKQNLLDHIFEFQNFPLERQMEDVENKMKETQTGVNGDSDLHFSNTDFFEQGNYDLSVTIIPRRQLVVSIHYNANVYEREIVEGAGSHSLQVLNRIIENETVPIGEITLLSEAEKHRILFEFNNNAADFSRDKSVHQLMEKHAAAAPHRVALVGAGTGDLMQYISYNQLNRQANRWAGVLRRSGIRRDGLVGVLMERSPLMATGILAVWKAGGAYIPIDPRYPVQRISQILTDSGAGVLMASSRWVNPGLEEAYRGEIIRLDSQNKTNEKDLSNCRLHLDMSALAYVIYTSGSTGKPKGAMVEHIGMMNHIQAKINDLHMTENSAVVQNASHTFDISVWQFFTALTLGARTVIYPDEFIMEPRQLIARLVKDHVTILEVVPSYLSVLLAVSEEYSLQGSNPDLPLDYLLVTGEEVKPALVKEWFRRYPGGKMVKAYGPT